MKKISVKNVHPKIKVKSESIQLLIGKILTSEKTDLGVDVIFVNDRFMRQLNRKFTKRDQTTDVLSFDMSTPPSSKKEKKKNEIEYPNLGDIYISLDQAKRQASEYETSFDDEIKLLVVHGLLHLLGYNHKSQKESNIMRKKVETYLQKR